MAWRRLCVFGKHGPERDVPAVLPKPSHCATHRVLVLRHALQEDSSAVLVLGEVGALLQLLDEFTARSIASSAAAWPRCATRSS